MIFEKQILAAYKQTAFSRCDKDGLAYYFTEKDFENLNKEEYAFNSSLNHRLQGFLYYYDNYRTDALVIFDHGFGPGHTAYMKEIEKLCKHGYRVFAYDHTGCALSGGENINGMAQSLHDLDDCLNTLKKDPRFNNINLYVMGHSWGGFSTLNISSIHQEVKKIVVLSGFVSVKDLIDTNFGGLLRGYRKAVYELEKKANPNYYHYDAVESLKNSKTKALLIYSDNDHLCKRPHFLKLAENLIPEPNVVVQLHHNKGHNPNYTETAASYLNEYVANKTKLLKNKNLTQEEKEAFVKSYDFDKMTEQDEKVWGMIFNHLD